LNFDRSEVSVQMRTFHLSITMLLIAFSFSYAIFAAIMERCAWYLLSSDFISVSKSTLLSKRPINDLKFDDSLSEHDLFTAKYQHLGYISLYRKT
jgi:hypothetical protein